MRQTRSALSLVLVAVLAFLLGYCLVQNVDAQYATSPISPVSPISTPGVRATPTMTPRPTLTPVFAVVNVVAVPVDTDACIPGDRIYVSMWWTGPDTGYPLYWNGCGYELSGWGE